MNDAQYVPTVVRSSALGHVFPDAVILFAPACLLLTVWLLAAEIGAAEVASQTNGSLTSVQRLERQHLQDEHQRQVKNDAPIAGGLMDNAFGVGSATGVPGLDISNVQAASHVPLLPFAVERLDRRNDLAYDGLLVTDRD